MALTLRTPSEEIRESDPPNPAGFPSNPAASPPATAIPHLTTNRFSSQSDFRVYLGVFWMETDRNPAARGRAAPYGSACAHCVRAKCKCILRTSGACERCHRLMKECTPSTTVRRRRTRSSSTQTARLEQKLDGLVALLRNTNPNTTNNASNPVDSTPVDTSSSPNPAPKPPTDLARILIQDDEHTSSAFSPGNSNSNSNSNRPPLSPSTPSAAATPASAFPYGLPPDMEPAPEEGERYFQTYCAKYLGFLPLFRFPSDMTSWQLRQERPFLWLCIMAVSATSIVQQNALERAVREIAARELLVEGERSIDLLLGLLGFVGWGHYQSVKCPLLTVLSHLCTALVLDLELQKPGPGDGNIRHRFYRSMAPHFYSKIRTLEPRNLEQRRVALACFFLTSSAASSHARVESLAWSPYLDECVDALATAQECPGDELLVQFVRLQRLATKVTSIRMALREAESEAGTRGIPVYISSLRGELSTLKESIPAHLVNNEILQLITLHTEITINELILLRAQHTPSLETTELESLVTCLTCAKSYFETVLRFSHEDYPALPFFFWKHLNLAVLTVIRLASLSRPGWDGDLVRRTLDLPEVLGRVADILLLAGREVGWDHTSNGDHSMNSGNSGGGGGGGGGGNNGNSGEGNMFARAWKMITVLRSWVVSVYEERGNSQNNGESNGQAQMSDSVMTDSVMTDGEVFSAFDQDLWMADMLDWWPYLQPRLGDLT